MLIKIYKRVLILDTPGIVRHIGHYSFHPFMEGETEHLTVEVPDGSLTGIKRAHRQAYKQEYLVPPDSLPVHIAKLAHWRGIVPPAGEKDAGHGNPPRRHAAHRGHRA